MECTFVVGQKVVCVDDRWPGYLSSPLCKGAIYTIRALSVGAGYGPDGEHVRGVGLVLDGVRNPDDDPFNEEGFYHKRFRPLVSRPTDISIFTELLNTPRKPIPDTHEREGA